MRDPVSVVLYIHASLKCHFNLVISAYLARLQLMVQIEL